MIEEPTVEITVPVGRLPRLEGVVVHRSVDIDRAWRGRRRGITVTSPMRALVDLGAIAPELVEDALDEALIARYCTIEAVHRELHRVAQHGRNGAGVLREILVRRALEDGLPDSRLEPVMARLCRRYGLAKPRFQYDVHDAAGRFIGRVDFAYPDLKVAIEIDGWSSRATPERFDHDLWRQNRLTLAGWTFLRFTKRRIIGEPAQVAAAIRDHLRAKTAA
jgi:very-short-patch-repair endonuclease